MQNSPFRDVLVCAIVESPDESSSSLLSYAISFASSARADLKVCAIGIQWDPRGTFQSAPENEALYKENEAISDRTREWSERALKEAMAKGVVCEVEHISGPYVQISSIPEQKGRTHDINLVAASADLLDPTRDLLENMLFNTGRPLLIVPRDLDRFSASRIVVAWDGTARAARALNDALPLLRLADEVSIASVVGEKDISTNVSGAELAPHLVRHGINATVHVIPPAADGDAAQALRYHAMLTDAEMIVMGGYGHSRLRQLVLGGVTNSLLQESSLPLLMSY